MGNVNIFNKVPIQIAFCVFLILGMTITPILGKPTEEPSDMLGPQQDQPKLDRAERDAPSITKKDLRHSHWKGYMKIIDMENDCERDEFLSLNSKSCEKCEKYCPGGEDMAKCGTRCQLEYIIKCYYNDIKYKKLLKMVVDLKSEVQSMREKEHEKSDLIVWIAYGALVIGVLVFAVIMVVKIKTWETKRRNDQKSVNDEIRKLKEKAIQQASPDTSPESTPDTTPVSTLSRNTVTTPLIEGNQQHNSRQDVQELRIIEDNPQDNQGGRVFNA